MGKWLQSNEHLTFEVRERVARITLNRPDRRNALSWEMLSELRAALLEADDLRSVSVIVLGGRRPRFLRGLRHEVGLRALRRRRRCRARTLSAPSKAPISRRINASSALVCAASSALAVVNVAVDEFFSLSFNLWLNQ
jgi:enoyl-CoA hydratase/carnithine racemase